MNNAKENCIDDRGESHDRKTQAEQSTINPPRDTAPVPATSARKAAANRANAQSSTGPKTAEGKRRSRRNAIRHGILVSALLVRNGAAEEEEAEFGRLLRDLRRELAPVGAYEDLLVEKIAIVFWRDRRILLFEAGCIEARVASREFLSGRPISKATMPEYLRLPMPPQSDVILRYQAANRRELEAALRQLEQAQAARAERQNPTREQGTNNQ
jgi:hypothetical protein